MKWKDFLNDQERERMVEIDEMRADFTAEIRRIYERCRKRMIAATKRERENGQENNL